MSLKSEIIKEYFNYVKESALDKFKLKETIELSEEFSIYSYSTKIKDNLIKINYTNLKEDGQLSIFQLDGNPPYAIDSNSSIFYLLKTHWIELDILNQAKFLVGMLEVFNSFPTWNKFSDANFTNLLGTFLNKGLEEQ